MVRKLLAFALVVAVLAFLAPTVRALENPHFYYDWNRYIPPDVLGLTAQAQEDTTTTGDYRDYLEHDYVLGFTADYSPGDPLYFIKRVEEGLTLAFTFNDQQINETRLELAGERLSEIETVSQEGASVATIGSLTQSYENTVEAMAASLTNLANEGQDVGSLTDLVDLECSKHALVLGEISLLVPAAAEAGLEQAIAASEVAVDSVADIEGQPPVPQAVVDRLQATKALGILTEEEVARVIDSDTRQEARTELREYVEVGVFSEADLTKFNQTAMASFPRGYYAILEIMKFKELNDLETLKPDEATIARIQEFSRTYEPGSIVPPEIRTWWAPMVRLEELQNTLRPDLINQDYLRNRTDYYQKYQEVVERIKPTSDDVAYVNRLLAINPELINDPSYARIKALADRFGTSTATTTGFTPTCGSNTHWVTVPYMPGGGYCIPNYEFPTGGETGETPCPSGYHRNISGGACYPDNPTSGTYLPAAGTCYSGYRWVTDQANPRGGYCSPQTVTDGGFPSPYYSVGYCLPGQTYRDGKCETYNPPPASGCSSGSWWNGTSCIQQKDCGQGYYQDYTGECRQSSYNNVCAQPSGGCGTSAWWDYSSCSCRSSSTTGTSSYPYATPYPSYPSSSTSTNCGTGYYWNGSYCAPTSSTSTTTTTTTTMSREQQESTCRSGGGTCQWNGDICNCQGYSSSGTTTTSTPAPTTSTPAPTTSAPQPTPMTDPATACTSMQGCSWNGSSCFCQ
ncbi:hypothetical protein A3F62_05245 [Candidatus Woesebacteria bacterium RIFCSPHIGHO2_12_FULL_44_11]|nr:MAG: hypothetical protein A3F62_05245 [Candidatus Woesebacteria bacterium RIFCSPHIGHO2_12_FULL_44_11]